MKQNFFFTGTIRDNLTHQIPLNETLAEKLIKIVHLDDDIGDYEEKKLDTLV